jgi:hypothetical protein
MLQTLAQETNWLLKTKLQALAQDQLSCQYHIANPSTIPIGFSRPQNNFNPKTKLKIANTQKDASTKSIKPVGMMMMMTRAALEVTTCSPAASGVAKPGART